MKVFNIFPLTIVKDKIIIDENDRKILVSMTCHQKYQNQSKIIYKHLK